MALSNAERIGKCLELLNKGLAPFVEAQLKRSLGNGWKDRVLPSLHDYQAKALEGDWDSQSLLQVMWDFWNDSFRTVLGHSERSMVSELRDIRNKWAHQKAFNVDDAYRALDTIERLLASVSSDLSDEVSKHKYEVIRQRFETKAKQEVKKSNMTAHLEGRPLGGLKPWREILTPHQDVASGTFQQAEFAADLWQVYLKEASKEYLDPIEFYKRTYLTEGLKDLLKNSLKRLSGTGGDPVIELQTNFGGGKTHSMLALYHLFGGTPGAKLTGADQLIDELGVELPTAVNRAVIVGTKIPPGRKHPKEDGTVVHTFWGEIAWQLGGKEAYELVKDADTSGTNPGDALTEVFNKYGPCLVMIDEWVAYARQLTDDTSLPAGSFDTHFTFAQTISECARDSKNTMLVVSIPASDIEIGGERGQQALSRLKNAIGRVENPWRPASAEEGFEIVRRRLFTELDASSIAHKDAIIKSFFDSYQSQHHEFPNECKDYEYKDRLAAAYPFHPLLFDFLYNEWSTLDRFQRTRGVLRLMAKVIHSLWKGEDKNLLIMPSMIPLDDPDVQNEIFKFLDDRWDGVINKDIDGPNAYSRKLDKDFPNFGRFAACRRVARTIFMGAAPRLNTENKGVTDKDIKLSCFQPGESAATFGDALRKFEDAAYLHEEHGRYWFSTQATVATTARRLAADFEGKPEELSAEIEGRIKSSTQRKKGDFHRVHVMPDGPSDVVDDQDARLVIIPIDHPHVARQNDSKAIMFAQGIFDSKGSSPRLNKNALVFAAIDSDQKVSLLQACAEYKAWTELDEEKEKYNLSHNDQRRVEKGRKSADETLNLRIEEAFRWMIYPSQANGSSEVSWTEERLNGHDPIAIRASSKLVSNNQLLTQFAPGYLKLEMDKIPLWDGDHVGVKELSDYFSRYLYLPRLATPSLLFDAIADGCNHTIAEENHFGYAEAFDSDSGKYIGLVFGRLANVVPDGKSVVIKPEVAIQHLPKTATPVGEARPEEGGPQEGGASPSGGTSTGVPHRFHASIPIGDPERIVRDIGTINQEVLSHFFPLGGVKATINLEIQITVDEGIPDNTVRTVTENCITLRGRCGFEES